MEYLNIIKKYQTIVFITLLAITGIFIYYPILGNDFVYDDYVTIAGNSTVQNNRNPIYFFLHPESFFPLGPDKVYRPVGAWFLAISFKLFSYNPYGYHALSTVLHILNSVLVFFLIKKLFKKNSFGFTGSLIFLIHPVQTEAVSWITLQPLLWMTFLGLLALTLILEKERLNKSFLYYTYIPSIFLAIYSKEQMILLPIFLILALRALKLDFKKYYTEIAVFFGTSFSYLILRYLIIESFTQRGPWGGDFYSAALTSVNVFTYYFKLLITGRPLTVSYDYFPITVSLDFRTIFSIIITIGFIALIIFFFNKARIFSFGLFWYLAALLPTLNVPFPLATIMNERFLYPAFPGIIIAVFSIIICIENVVNISRPSKNCNSEFDEESLPFERGLGIRFFASLRMTKIQFQQFSKDLTLLRPSSLIITILFAALLIYYGAITRNRLYEWKDDETLWRSAMKISPHPQNRIEYARALHKNFKYEDALKMYLDELNMPMLDYVLNDSIAAEKYKKGQRKFDLRRAVEIKNDSAIKASQIYISQKKFIEAEKIIKARLDSSGKELKRALFYQLTKVYLEAKKYGQALETAKILNKQNTEDETKMLLTLSIYLKTGILSQANQVIETIKDKNLKLAMPAIAKAYSEKESGNWIEVYNLLYPLLFLNPTVQFAPYLLLAETSINLDHLPTAKLAYLRLLILDPTLIQAQQGFDFIRKNSFLDVPGKQ